MSSDRASNSGHAERVRCSHPSSYVPIVSPSVLHRMEAAYGKGTNEVGYQTDGHQCVTKADLDTAQKLGSSLLYGEVLPAGVAKLLDFQHLDAQNASVLMDLGSGTGKLALQAFISFPNLKDVYGVELCQPRYLIGETALLRFVSLYPEDYVLVCWVKGSIISISSTKSRRQLTLQHGNLLDVSTISKADIVILETDLPQVAHPQLVEMLHRSVLRPGCRLLSYLNLRNVWSSQGQQFPFAQLAVNRSTHDRFLTSWSYTTGHHFYLWVQCDETEPLDGDDELILPHSVSRSMSPRQGSLVHTPRDRKALTADKIVDPQTHHIDSTEPVTHGTSRFVHDSAAKPNRVLTLGSDSDDVSPSCSPTEISAVHTHASESALPGRTPGSTNRMKLVSATAVFASQ